AETATRKCIQTRKADFISRPNYPLRNVTVHYQSLKRSPITRFKCVVSQGAAASFCRCQQRRTNPDLRLFSTYSRSRKEINSQLRNFVHSVAILSWAEVASPTEATETIQAGEVAIR